MKPISIVRCALLTSMLLPLGCDGGSTTPPSDAGGLDGSQPPDGGPRTDAGDAPDAGEGCVEATVSGWQLVGADDVSIRYRARISPRIRGESWDLVLEFNRYDTSYVGEFPLGEGMEASYGSCARCVVSFTGGVFSTRALFARAGTLELREDPFFFRLDATLRDVRLEEVMLVGPTLDIEPVPGGACVTLAETTVTGVFPPREWRCPAAQFGDGETCHCECGMWDPDCDLPFCVDPEDPSCDPTPRPVAGCSEGALCTFEGRCAERCDLEARVPCATGFCGASVEGDRCYDPAADPVANVNVGEPCPVRERGYHCAVDAAGFARGMCDPDDWTCHAVCSDDGDCGAGDICWVFYVDPENGNQRGYCNTAPPPCLPAGETCSSHLDCCSVLCEGLTEGGTGTCA